MKTIINITSIISIVFLATMFSAHATSKLERIGEPITITSVDTNTETLLLNDMVVNKSVIYSTWKTKKKFTLKDQA